jgi:beta-aspartyl-peptidase (threonine type)
MRPSILVHGGAGPCSPDDLESAQREGCLQAARAGFAVLASGGAALEAVEVACRALEDDPGFNAGTGAVLNAEGECELDASIMRGTDLGAGAVAAVRTVKNPITAARLVMERSPHVLLVGAGAEAFVVEQGLARIDPRTLVTPLAHRRWVERHSVPHGTIGAVAVDTLGRVAAGTSTGGTSGKLKGRVGDSPLIGCGTCADDRLGAVSCTGHGEVIIRVGLARAVLEQLGRGASPHAAAAQALIEVRRLGGDAGVIVAAPDGRLGWAHLSERMARAWVNASAEGTGFLSDSHALSNLIVEEDKHH